MSLQVQETVNKLQNKTIIQKTIFIFWIVAQNEDCFSKINPDDGYYQEPPPPPPQPPPEKPPPPPEEELMPPFAVDGCVTEPILFVK